MNFAINDLALSCQSQTTYDSITNIKTLISLIKELKKRNILTTICSDKKFFGSELAPDYYFEQMLNDERLTKDERLFIKTFIVNSSRIVANTKQTFEVNDKCSHLLAYSYFNNIFVLSIRTSSLYDKPYIYGTLYNDTETFEACLPNLSVINDIEIHKFKLGIRIYENNPKHKINYGWGSPMDLSDDVAQRVLDSAIPVPNNINHLINYYNNKFYSFRRHHDNHFHGYIDTSLPEKFQKLLNV